MIATLVTVLVVGVGLVGIFAGLQRHHARTAGLGRRLFGSDTAEDRDIPRIRAELDAAGSERTTDPPRRVHRPTWPSLHLSAR